MSATRLSAASINSPTGKQSFFSCPKIQGGTQTISGGYRILSFTTSGVLTVNTSVSLEYLVVGGGGGSSSGFGGGDFDNDLDDDVPF
jgi:hypothetical protein